MFSRRISVTEAAPMPISAGDARSARNAASRWSAVSFFEIVQHVQPVLRGTRRPSTTAAATTGPASGPRPASSTPATRPPAASSISRLGIRPCLAGGWPSRESASSSICKVQMLHCRHKCFASALPLLEAAP